MRVCEHKPYENKVDVIILTTWFKIDDQVIEWLEYYLVINAYTQCYASIVVTKFIDLW